MTTKLQAVQNELAQLRALLAQAGIFAPRSAPVDKHRKDYIEFGSPEHMALLGLVEVEPGDEALYITRKSGDKTYRLEDEVTAFMHYNDPKQVAALVLRQKIGELEAGKPPVFDGALPLWRPEPVPGETWEQSVMPA